MVEDQLKKTSQQQMMNSMKCNVIIGILMIVALNLVGTHFQGIVVARLPFEPFSLIQGITHRNIEGTDFKECAYLFIYILSTFVLRTNIKKIFGILLVYFRLLTTKTSSYYVSTPKARMITETV
jgi:calcium load-activated calcium channel